MSEPIVVFWFRRDLRLDDNTGLEKALHSGYPVLPVFIFDTNILDHLENKSDLRVQFIYNELQSIHQKLSLKGSGIRIYHGTPVECWKKIMAEYEVKHVYVNRDYEPYGRQRDESIFHLLQSHSIGMTGSKDQVIFEKNEVIKDDGTPYTVFTPYSRKWKQKYHEQISNSTVLTEGGFFEHTAVFPTLETIGFRHTDFQYPSREIPVHIVKEYEKTRDLPAVNGTSRLSMHLRFGTVSIRQLVSAAHRWNEKWLNELIWRDFYQMILFHHPHSIDRSIKPAYDRIQWVNDEKQFEAWCSGLTGYPLVDAGMRELNQTGFMHNRVRMVVASFLVKHLLIDWRWGERYFAEQLLDFDLASNVGGWQWATGGGCDAAPYFRIFNPQSQQQKFDPDFEYIRKWVPEMGSREYPAPIVDHSSARIRALQVYKNALQGDVN